MNRQPKQISREEARYLFLEHITSLVKYWDQESRRASSREKLEGLAFSFLSALDGCAAGLPGYLLIPMQTEEDLAYAKEQGYDYNPLPPEKADEADIGGSLHEEFHKYMQKEIKRPENLFDFGAYLAEMAKQFHQPKLKRDTSTPESKAFWEGVDKTAERVDNWPDWMKG